MWQRNRWQTSRNKRPKVHVPPVPCRLCGGSLGDAPWVICLAWPKEPVRLQCMHKHVEAQNLLKQISQSGTGSGSPAADAAKSPATPMTRPQRSAIARANPGRPIAPSTMLCTTALTIARPIRRALRSCVSEGSPGFREVERWHIGASAVALVSTRSVSRAAMVHVHRREGDEGLRAMAAPALGGRQHLS